MIFVGVDPGKTGGVSVLDQEGNILLMEAMKDLTWFANTMRDLKQKDMMAFIEKGQVMGVGEGVRGMFNYGYHCGSLEGVLITLKMKFELVPPQSWCPVMYAGISGDQRRKEKSKKATDRLFPGIDLRDKDKPRSRNAHEGIMDALLIAEYGRRKWIKR